MKTGETDQVCTCPNCQSQFAFNVFDDHIQKCQRKKNFEFPKYRMIVTDSKCGHAGDRFLSAGEAGVLFDSGTFQVDIGKEVLESDLTLRPMVNGEKYLISTIADKCSASK